MTMKARPFGDFLLCLVGPTVWAVHFFVMYGAEALACTGRPAAYTIPGIGIAATTVALAGLGAFVVWQIRERRRRPGEVMRFLNDLALALAAMSMLAILAVASPVLHLPACGAP